MAVEETSRPEGEWGLLLVVKTTPANRRELLLTLDEFRRQELADSGCAGCQILEDSSNSNLLMWTEWWVDRSRADLAIERPRFRALIGAITLLAEVERADWIGRRSGPALRLSGKAARSREANRNQQGD